MDLCNADDLLQQDGSFTDADHLSSENGMMQACAALPEGQ